MDDPEADRALRFLASAAMTLAGAGSVADIVSTALALAVPAVAQRAQLSMTGDAEPEGDAAREALATGRAVAFEDGLVIPLPERGITIALLTLFRLRDRTLAEAFAQTVAAALINGRVEQRLAEANVTLDRMMQNAPVGIGILDAERRFVRVNPALARINGVPMADHIGKHVSEVVPRLGLSEEARQQVLDRGEAVVQEVSGLTLAGDELHHLLVTWYPLSHPSGEPFGMGTIVLDVTEHRRAEHQLRHLAEASRLLASSLDYSTTLANVAQMMVPELADWCSIDMLEEGSVRRLAVVHADPERAPLAEAYSRLVQPTLRDDAGIGAVLRTGKSEWRHAIPSELIDEVPNAELREVLRALGVVSYLVVPIPVGTETIGAISLVMAESGRHYGESDLSFAEELARRAGIAVENARLYGEAQQAIRAREDVLAFVSHDLKNPLTAVLMNAALLERATPKDEKVQRHAQMIVRAADRMNRLVHDLLDWASLRAGRLSLTPAAVPLRPLLSELIAMLLPVAAGRKQSLTFEVPDDLCVRADRDRLARVVSNIVGNALKYTPEGGSIEVTARRVGKEAWVAVKDTGPGIAPEELPHVFDRYFRAKQAGSNGTGLGLAIAKGIVEAHGGRLWAESEVGHGSTFVFSIPIAKEGP